MVGVPSPPPGRTRALSGERPRLPVHRRPSQPERPGRLAQAKRPVHPHLISADLGLGPGICRAPSQPSFHARIVTLLTTTTQARFEPKPSCGARRPGHHNQAQACCNLLARPSSRAGQVSAKRPQADRTTPWRIRRFQAPATAACTRTTILSRKADDLRFPAGESLALRDQN